MSLDLVDMLHQDGVENPSGLATIHGIALLSYFTTIQKPAGLQDNAATISTVGSITQAHVFAAGKCMHKVYGTEAKAEVKDDVGGDLDSQIVKGSGTIMIPGSRADLNGMMRLLNASNGLIFAQEADGTIRQYGSETFPCHFKMTYGSDKLDGYRGYTLTWTNYGPSIIYVPGLNFTPAAGN